jgi:hypothetical protein
MKKIVVITSGVLSLLLGIAAPVYAQQDHKNEKQDQSKQQQKDREQGKPEQQHAQQQRQDRHQQAEQQQRNEQNNQRQQQAQQQQRQDRQQQTEQQQRNEQNNQRQQQAQQQQRQDRQQQTEQRQRQDQNDQRQQRDQQQRREYGQQQYSQQSEQERRGERSTWQEHRAGNWQSDHRTWQQRGGYDGYRIPDNGYRSYFGSRHSFRIYGLPFSVYNGYPRFQYEGYWITLLDPWPESWSNDWYDNDDVYIAYGNDGYYMYNRRDPDVGIAISISM